MSLTGGSTWGFVKADTGVEIMGPQRLVLPGYFEAMGVRPIAGRLLEEADRAAATPSS